MGNKIIKISLLVLLVFVLLFSNFPLRLLQTRADFVVGPQFFVSDTSDPFNPLFEESEIEIFALLVDYNGDPVPCENLTLEIENTNRSWQWGNTWGEVIEWDGKDNQGNFVSAGTYVYKSTCQFQYWPSGPLSQIEATGTISVLPVKERFFYRQAEEISCEDSILCDTNYKFSFASLIHDSSDILKLSSSSVSIENDDKVLLAKLEFPQSLPSQDYSGAGVKIEKGDKIYFLGFSNSPDYYGSHLLVSSNKGETWQETSGDYGGWLDENNNLFLWLKMEDIGSLPWKATFLSGVVFNPLEYEYKIAYQSEPIDIPSEVPQKWSFAIITDLHIGRGYSDYDGTGYGSDGDGEDYYLTERLKNVVDWVIDNKDEIDCGTTTCPINFLAVLGDIADSAEKSEFWKARKILDKLNDYGIPYVPVFGNHDVWPYTDFEEATSTLGENYFDEIFWNENATNTKLIKQRLNWQRDEENPKYKNFAFNYGGINFIGLDFVSRNHNPLGGVGADAVAWREECATSVSPGTTCPQIIRKQETLDWLKEKLEESKDKPVILFSHHPMKKGITNAFSYTPFGKEYETLQEILKNTTAIFDFAGHIHSFEEIHGKLAPANANVKYKSISGAQVLTTEALMVGSNGRGVEKETETEENGVVDGKKGIIRIVKVFDKNNIDPYNWETTETGDEFVAFNPSLNWGFSLKRHLNFPCVEVEADAFTEKKYQVYWDLGDGETIENVKEKEKCYNNTGEYKITLTMEDPYSDFSESISKEVEIKKGIIPHTIKKIGDFLSQGYDFISEKAQMSFGKIGQIKEDAVSIFKKKSPLTPIGKITVHFENLNDDLDLTGLKADTDPDKQKSILYMSQWPKEVERSKILFLPIK